MGWYSCFSGIRYQRNWEGFCWPAGLRTQPPGSTGADWGRGAMASVLGDWGRSPKLSVTGSHTPRSSAHYTLTLWTAPTCQVALLYDQLDNDDIEPCSMGGSNGPAQFLELGLWPCLPFSSMPWGTFGLPGTGTPLLLSRRENIPDPTSPPNPWPPSVLSHLFCAWFLWEKRSKVSQADLRLYSAPVAAARGKWQAIAPRPVCRYQHLSEEAEDVGLVAFGPYLSEVWRREVWLNKAWLAGLCWLPPALQIVVPLKCR